MNKNRFNPKNRFSPVEIEHDLITVAEKNNKRKWYYRLNRRLDSLRDTLNVIPWAKEILGVSIDDLKSKKYSVYEYELVFEPLIKFKHYSDNPSDIDIEDDLNIIIEKSKTDLTTAKKMFRNEFKDGGFLMVSITKYGANERNYIVFDYGVTENVTYKKGIDSVIDSIVYAYEELVKRHL